MGKNPVSKMQNASEVKKITVTNQFCLFLFQEHVAIQVVDGVLEDIRLGMEVLEALYPLQSGCQGL